jgi:hypothetical protein
MSAASETQKAYSRGYWRGSRGAWPDHRPPAPPNEIIAAIVCAAQNLRDAADGVCAVLMEEDEFATQLAPRIDDFDTAMTRYGEWLRSNPLQENRG